ncbi:hypothetical protein CHS0354_015522 [Potamilus streckersoni]|uniref:Sodium/myo-inositol cotransporter n=1 Tax=Potamilus streckersoni TaxID=2493646 RepID=A0AAE0SEM7_9BIVA|nr:hypothetical protein CHS0354_015522 [Potamilus streckersoni]
MNWILVGASLFASNIGSIHFVGLAGSGAASGIAIGLYELNAMYILLILGYLFVPVYIASGVFTMPEYLKRRFGGQRIQISLAVLALLVYIFTKISADLYAGAIFMEQSLNWNIYWSIMLLLAVAALFTITGGLTAVIWTDFIQTIIMLLGATILMIISFVKVGGFSAMVEQYPLAIPNSTLYGNTTCGKPRDDYMHLFRDPKTGDLPWPGLLGLSINSVWYWCSDQVIVQRALAGKTYDHAKAGTIFCSYLKILPLFLLVFPGMIARILFPDTVGCVDPEICKAVCGSETGCSNIAYPSLVINLMPYGARGLMLAVMMAALMSSLTSIFNSSSTIFAMDIWTRIRKQASELEVMIIGRVFVIILVVISVIWIPVVRMSQGSELFVYIQEVSSFMQPPICCIFILGIFWSRVNEMGAFYGLIAGMVMGMVRFIWEYSYQVPSCMENKPDPRPAIIKNIHYLYYAVFLFFFTGLVAVVISLLTKPIEPRCLERLTFWTRHSTKPRLDIDEWNAMGTKKEPDVSKEIADGKTELQPINEETKPSDDVVEEPKEMNSVPENKVESDLKADDESTLMKNDEESELPVVIIEQDSKVIKGKKPILRRILNWVCGIEDYNKYELSTHKIQVQDMLSIHEYPKWQIVSNVLSVLVMVIAMVFFGYFA